jgi:hypothetical protein
VVGHSSQRDLDEFHVSLEGGQHGTNGPERIFRAHGVQIQFAYQARIQSYTVPLHQALAGPSPDASDLLEEVKKENTNV